jgi:hypothetical protein
MQIGVSFKNRKEHILFYINLFKEDTNMNNFVLKKLAIYELDPKFIAFLLSCQSNNIYATPKRAYSSNKVKGFIITNGKFDYFVPLIPAKKYNSRWTKNHYCGNFLISEICSKQDLNKSWYFKKTSNPDIFLHLLSVIRVQKMFPIPDNVCTEIDVNNIRHENTRHCLKKAIEYFQSHQDKILNSARHIYKEQSECNNPTIYPYYTRCNFRYLEVKISEFDIFKGVKEYDFGYNWLEISSTIKNPNKPFPHLKNRIHVVK